MTGRPSEPGHEPLAPLRTDPLAPWRETTITLVPPNTRAVVVPLACLPLAAAAAAVRAQGLGGLVADTGLESSDHAICARRGPGSTPSGSPWSARPGTGPTGRAGARGRVELAGLDGVRADLDHAFRVRDRATDQFRSRRCRTPEGVWQIAPE
jgi:hypothetical protein